MITPKLLYCIRVIYWSDTSWRWVPEPAHSHSQSSLQPVWAVGRYLSRYPVAGVAFGAPGTCKQHTPQTTAICDGARGTLQLYLNTHTACRDAPACYMGHRNAARCAQDCCPASVPCSKGIPIQRTRSQCYKATRGQLTW